MRMNAERTPSGVMLAAPATEPVIKERLLETTQGWMRLAADLATFDDRKSEWRPD